MALGDVRFYPNEIDRLLYMPGGVVGVGVRRIAMKVASEAARIARDELGKNPEYEARTGRYAAGFQVEVEYPIPKEQGGFKYHVVNRTTGQTPRRTMSYAGPLETGAQAHPIRPRKASGMLVFYIGGRRVQTKQVFWKPRPGRMQPGEGYRIMERALRNVIQAL